MSRNPGISNPVIEPGSTILVTGANGLIGSHCVDQAIAAGYKVRATVREIKRCEWLISHFEDKYGKGCIELFEVPDVYAENYLDNAVKGVSSVIHTVPVHFDFMVTSAEPSVAQEIKTLVGALNSASKEPLVKTFALTTSVWAAHPCWVKGPYILKQDSWNKASITQAYDTKYQEQDKGLQIFQAAKARMEQEAWKWYKENKPGYTLNTILPHTVIGPIIDGNNQKLGTTGRLIQALYEGGPEMAIGMMNLIGPQRYINSSDNGRLHVIGMIYIHICVIGVLLIAVAAIDPEVKNERIYGFAGPSSWNDILDILRKHFPNRTFLDNFNQGNDEGKADHDRGAELLQKHYGNTWVGLEDTVMSNLKSLVRL
jgi:nucleoside-diphosphate-sugar epimerase